MAKAEARSANAAAANVTVGIVAAVAASAGFVVLTASTGTTYHLFPLLIGFMPGGLPRVLAERPISRRDGVLAIITGVVAVGAAWLALELLDEMPAATFFSDQPGGVPGEFVLFGVLGALIGGWWGSRGS